jgi:hypothetical protein
MGLSKIFLTAAIGGIFTGIAIPVAQYFIPRLFNRRRVKVNLDTRKESDYIVFNLRIRNNSFSSLRNVYAYVDIDNEVNDIKKEETRIKFYCSDSKVTNGMLSWSKEINKVNSPNIDINQGETPDLNFIRFHNNEAIEVASEQGFFDEEKKNKSRVVLKANRNFSFTILVTADNLWPIRDEFIFDNTTKTVRRKGSA